MFRAALTIRQLKQIDGETTTAVATLSHQLLQRCSVSGTPKGKAKLAVTPVKKSFVNTKKGSAPAAAGGVPKKVEELQDMTEKFLNAGTPIRHLKPKAKKREAMREKLGLVSRARQREIDMLKKQAKEGTGFEKPLLMGTPGLDYVSLGLVDVNQIPKYELTVEDGGRLAKEHSRFLMRKHREKQKVESTLIRLKKEAIEALPKNLKAAALVPDLSPIPAKRLMATLTPPVEGHREVIMEAARLNARKMKLK